MIIDHAGKTYARLSSNAYFTSLLRISTSLKHLQHNAARQANDQVTHDIDHSITMIFIGEILISTGIVLSCNHTFSWDMKRDSRSLFEIEQILKMEFDFDSTSMQRTCYAQSGRDRISLNKRIMKDYGDVKAYDYGFVA